MMKAYLKFGTTQHPIEGPFCSIGRDPTCDVSLDDQELSRKHALILVGGEHYSILDFKSSNGVFVNSRRVDHIILKNGDVIQMGENVFEFVKEGDTPSPGEVSTTTFHTMVDLERSLNKDTMVMLEERKPKEADAFEKLVILFQVSKVINSVLDGNEVLNKVIDLALKVIDADRGFIMLVNANEELEPVVARQMDTEAHGGPMTISRNIVENCRESKKPILTQDALVDPRFQTSGSIQMYNIRSAMCVPLLDKERQLLGVLYVDNRIQSHSFEEDDLTLLVAFADQAAIAIDNARLYGKIQEETRIRNNLSRYLSPDLVDRLVTEKGSSSILGGEKVEATILFADIRGFTTFSENWGSRDVITFLNEYLSSMTRVIFQYKGTLDKYIGDGIMAVFGAPFNPAYAPARAVMAALHMQSEMKQLQKRWVELGYPPMEIGIGINTGEVTAGNIGFSDESNEARSRLDFTVIGDAVNTAARLESSATGGQVLISQASYDQVADRFTVECLGDRMVKGKSKAVRVYHVTGVKSE